MRTERTRPLRRADRAAFLARRIARVLLSLSGRELRWRVVADVVRVGPAEILILEAQVTDRAVEMQAAPGVRLELHFHTVHACLARVERREGYGIPVDERGGELHVRVLHVERRDVQAQAPLEPLALQAHLTGAEIFRIERGHLRGGCRA